MLIFRRLNERASIPYRAPGSVGYDLAACEDGELVRYDTAKIPVGLAVVLPAGCYGRIAARSSLALMGLLYGGGVIDPNYRGELNLIITNLGRYNYTYKRGDRLAQLILEKCEIPETMEIFDNAEWAQLCEFSERGSAGFGSTGV